MKAAILRFTVIFKSFAVFSLKQGKYIFNPTHISLRFYCRFLLLSSGGSLIFLIFMANVEQISL